MRDDHPFKLECKRRRNALYTEFDPLTLEVILDVLVAPLLERVEAIEKTSAVHPPYRGQDGPEQGGE